MEVADIFRRHGERYRARHRLPLQQLRRMGAIESCRTAALGGHVERCSHCPHQRISYNSCRNRHCPKCQNLERNRWLERRQSELLPAPYFHVVFTIPEQLHALALRNQAAIYGILFQASAQTLLTIAADPRHLGARIGFFSILHTWGQNLLLHPHVHCVVTGGGLSPDAQRWIACRPGFFLSVRVLSRLFRRLFLEALQRAFAQGQLKEPGDLKPLLALLSKREWVVYAKPPFGGPAQVLDYLGRYTHRVAISRRSTPRDPLPSVRQPKHAPLPRRCPQCVQNPKTPSTANVANHKSGASSLPQPRPLPGPSTNHHANTLLLLRLEPHPAQAIPIPPIPKHRGLVQRPFSSPGRPKLPHLPLTIAPSRS
jgi:hypothetical protein